MTQIQHPTLDTIGAYLETPEDREFSELRRHLASCRVCRSQVLQLQDIQQGIRQHIPFIREGSNREQGGHEGAGTKPLSHTIEQYVDGQLSASEQAEAGKLINSDPAALKAALHYATHSSAMRRELDPAGQNNRSPVDRDQVDNTQFFDRLKSWLSWKQPVWTTVPATAALVFVVVFNFNSLQIAGKQPAYSVASYQDNPVVRFNDPSASTPGVGFFKSANQTLQAYSKVGINLEPTGILAMQWPAIDKVSNYTINLYVIANGKKTPVAEQNTRQTNTLFEKLKIMPGHRYEWKLSGTTNDGKRFVTVGGFVIN